MVNRGKLSAILGGVEEGLGAASRSYLHQKEREGREEKELYKRIMANRKEEQKQLDREQKEIDRQIKFKEKELKLIEKTENNPLSTIPFVKNWVASPRKKELEGELNELYLKQQGLNAQEVEESAEESFKEKHPIINSFKELATKDWDKSQKYKDIGATVSKSPGRWMKMAMNLLGNLDEKMQNSREKQGLIRLSPSLKEQLNPSIEAIEKGDQSIDSFVGANPESDANLATEILTDLALPGPKVARGKNAFVKNAAKGATAGAGYGALYSGGDPEAMKLGALLGGAIHPAIGKISAKTKGKKLNKIKSRAKITDPNEVLARAEVMGEEALIPELVGDDKYINRLKRDTSKANVNRMEKVETNIRDHAKGVSKNLPRGRDIELYEQLENQAASAKEKGSQLYDITKESGIGKHGVLEKPFIEEWMNIVNQSEPHIKGLPSLKPGAPKHSMKKLQNALLGAPTTNDSYKAFAIQHNDIIPTPTDFLKFRGKVGKMLAKADASNVNELTELYQKINTLIEKVDPESNLAKARHNWATEVAPFSETPIKEARDSVRFQDNIQGRPKVSEVFKKSESAKAFEKLSTQDKEKVLGGFLEEILEREEVSPERAVQELWKKLPDHIKRTNDPGIQKLLKQIRAQGHLNKTTSSLQQTTTSSIGSRIAIGAKKARNAAHLYSVFSGNLTPSAIIGTVEGGTKGVIAGKRAAFRKKMSQKNLKYYLDPKLLDEVFAGKKLKHRDRLPIKVLNQKNHDE